MDATKADPPDKVLTDYRGALDTRGAADFLGLRTRHLEALRHTSPQDSPPWKRVGGRIIYPMDQLRAWLAKGLEGGVSL